MLKRIGIYLKEMYPVIPRLILGVIIFSEIYFIILLNNGITNFNVGISELVGSFTVFSFLLSLRIADDFKDYELDCKLFKERPLPSGRVKKKDLVIFITLLIIVTVVLNILFMNNFIYFCVLYVYGILMSVWFFQKSKIQKSLPLALITHNPVQIILNIYIISFTCTKYSINMVSWVNALVAMTLYFPALIWEISRKIRAPKDETEYVTYSKIFGYKKAVKFVMLLTVIDIITNILLVLNLNKISVIVLLINLAFFIVNSIIFLKDPERFKFVSKVEIYTYITECIMIATVFIYLLFGAI